MASIKFTDAKETHGASDTSLHTMTGWSRGRTSHALADNSLGCMGMNQTHKSMGTNLFLKTDSIMGRKTRKLLRESRMPSGRK